MAEYATDEEQVEAIKKWWAENGYYLIGGIVLGLGLLIGWNYYKNYRITQGEAASAVYSQLVGSAATGQDGAAKFTSQLDAEYGGTPYVALGHLQVAKAAVDGGDLDLAAQSLRAAIEQGQDLNLVDVARLRLARVLLAKGDVEGALAESNKVTSPSYLSLREEVRGDAFVASGKTSEAREAYDKALLSAGGRAEFLQLKRDNLGPAKADS